MVNTPSAIGHYSTYEVARLAGVRPRRIGQWHRHGVLPRTGRLPGTYSYADAAEAILAHYLVEEGLRPGEVAKLVRNLRSEHGDWPLTNAPLAHEGKLVVIREGEDLVLDALHHVGQRVIEATLDLKQVRDALAHGGWVALLRHRPAVEVDPMRLSGVPTVRGRRIPTELVAKLAAEPSGHKILHDEYALTESQIKEAVAYEADVEEAIAA